MRPQIFHRLASSKITTAPYWCHDWPLRDTMAVQRCHMLGQACDTAHCKLKTSARAHGGVIAFTRAAARVFAAPNAGTHSYGIAARKAPCAASISYSTSIPGAPHRNPGPV